MGIGCEVVMAQVLLLWVTRPLPAPGTWTVSYGVCYISFSL
jgi:hypothetical protein